MSAAFSHCCHQLVGESKAYLPAHVSSAIDLTFSLISAQTHRWLRAVLVADAIYPSPCVFVSAFNIHTILFR